MLVSTTSLAHGTRMVQLRVQGFPISNPGITDDQPNFIRFATVARTVSRGNFDVKNRFYRGPSAAEPG
jgi:hypothetical protein